MKSWFESRVSKSQDKKNISIQIRSKLKREKFHVTAEKYKKTIWDNYQLSDNKVDNLKMKKKDGHIYIVQVNLKNRKDE